VKENVYFELRIALSCTFSICIGLPVGPSILETVDLQVLSMVWTLAHLAGRALVATDNVACFRHTSLKSALLSLRPLSKTRDFVSSVAMLFQLSLRIDAHRLLAGLLVTQSTVLRY
jgi:predicted Kef-type K+ transport protein